jgi:hypothetical protein
MEKYSFGDKGIISKFNVPVIKQSLSKGLNAGTSSNPIAKTRNAIVGAMREVIDGYDEDDSDLTVADLLSIGFNKVLRGIDVLAAEKSVTTTYYEVDDCGAFVGESTEYDKEKRITSLMWTVPLGKHHRGISFMIFYGKSNNQHVALRPKIRRYSTRA